MADGVENKDNEAKSGAPLRKASLPLHSPLNNQRPSISELGKSIEEFTDSPQRRTSIGALPQGSLLNRPRSSISDLNGNPLPRANSLDSLSRANSLERPSLRKVSTLESLESTNNFKPLTREGAVLGGLPPMVAAATQLSTMRWGNTAAYRDSGLIPPGLYHTVISGEATPKDVGEKAKSSNFGPQEGFAAADSRNGRFQQDSNGKWEIRPDIPPQRESRVLHKSLRDILTQTFKDVPPKYELIPPDGLKNLGPDGVLKFRQINHPADEVKAITFSINLKEAIPVSPDDLKSYELITSELQKVSNKASWEKPGSPLFEKLDALCPTYIQHTPDAPPEEIKVIGGIVRDCDLECLTRPSNKSLGDNFGKNNINPEYFKPLDMSPHPHYPQNATTEQKDEANLVAEMEANDAKTAMLDMLLKINKSEWGAYNALKNEAEKQPGYDKNTWERDNADKKPFVPEKMGQDPKLMATLVVRVGKGTPMELYQGLEINIIQQKILAAQKNPQSNFSISDLRVMSAGRKEALHNLHQVEIEISKETLSRCFIQHPTETRNEHYTCPRGKSVAVSGTQIVIATDEQFNKYLDSKQQIRPINFQYIAEGSLGNANAKEFVKQYLNHAETYDAQQPELKGVVKTFLENPKNQVAVNDIIKNLNESAKTSMNTVLAESQPQQQMTMAHN